MEIVFEEQTVYYESFKNFVTYKIKSIEYFITSELITAFRFQNSSDRDPYYGESLYENLMQDEHKLYGLNSSACEAVVKMLGGLSETSTTATAAGLKGTEVVAMGLTPEVMNKYGLYAYKIYFELPRGIYAYTPETNKNETLSNQLDDYAYYNTLGFNLYISEVDPVTNTRYIASDLYDIVSVLPASDLVFLNHDFESFWARRQLILLDIRDISGITIDFNMKDLEGKYQLDLTHDKTKYETSTGSIGTFDKTIIKVTPIGECTPNKLTEYIKNNTVTGFVSIDQLYDHYYPNKLDDAHKKVYPDSFGTSYFKDAIRMLYLTGYVDVMPKEDRDEAMKAENLVMRMSFDVPKSSAYEYVYDFYRADDRRVLVSIYQADSKGNAVSTPISDFYISSFAFKKIVRNIVGIFNAELIEPDVAYIDDKKEN